MQIQGIITISIIILFAIEVVLKLLAKKKLKKIDVDRGIAIVRTSQIDNQIIGIDEKDDSKDVFRS